MKLLGHKWFIGAYIFIVIFILITSHSWKIHKEYPYQFTYGSDVNQYYSYLPALFIEGDLSFSFPNNRSYWLIAGENGKALPKMTSGMAILYSPFFLVGHLVANFTDYPADGYSVPYSISLKIGTYFYVSIGLYLLYLALLYFFKPWISAVSIVLVFISTNLFYYTLSEGEMSHSYLLWLFAVVILNTLKWIESYKLKNLLFIALALGMSVLIRPTSIIIVLFPVLFLLQGKQPVNLLLSYWRSFSIAILVFLLPVFVQILYWKIYGGTWIRWSYGDEHFYFNNPHTIEFLFSYRKGWLLYTPLMIFSIIGLFMLPKYAPKMKFSIPIILILAVFVLSSWWCWWFGGSYGSRAMVEFYAFLIFPLAAFINLVSKVKYVNYTFVLVFSFTTFYNVLGHHKKTWWQLHWDSMTKESFWYTFSKLNLNDEEKQKLEKLYETPDYKNARKGLDERKGF